MAYMIFGASVQGASHVRKNTPMEDYSFFSQKRNRYIMAVSDGHGDLRCMRSMIGSELAVKAAVDALQDFPEDVCTGENCEVVQHVKALCSRIAKSWTCSVIDHLKQNPLSEAEYEAGGNLSAEYKKGKHLEHIYGATLIAGLITEDFLLLVQKGDGHAVIVYDDAEICENFIPWDERCFGNVTTSLCDSDAADTFSYRLIQLKNGRTISACGISQKGNLNEVQCEDEKREIVAVFLGTDGVEDSFPDIEGTCAFYAGFLERCARDGIDAVIENLDQELRRMSEKGSCDDISLTGIVNDTLLEGMRSSFLSRVEEYLSKKEYQRCMDRLSSMGRKRAMLKAKMAKARSFAEQACKACETEECDDAAKEAYCVAQAQYEICKQNHDVYEQEYLSIERRAQEVLLKMDKQGHPIQRGKES